MKKNHLALKFLPLCALSLCIFIIPSVYASVSSYQCENCNSLQMAQIALQYGQQMSPPQTATIYVINSSQNVTKKYFVIRDWKGGDATCDRIPAGSKECIPITQIHTQETESTLNEFMQFMRIAQSSGYSHDASFPDSAFADIRNPQQRESIDHYLKDRYETYTYLAAGAYALGINVIVPFYVRYDDGSTGAYQWNVQLQRYEPVTALYKDKFGNMIPVSVQQLTNGQGGVNFSFSFSGGAVSDAQNFIQQLQDIGVPVTYGSGSGNPAVPVVCTSMVSNGVVTSSCRWGD